MTFIWVICGIIAIIGVYLSWEFQKLEKEGVSTVAYVTKIEKIPKINGNGNNVDRVSVSFDTPDKGEQEESIIRGDDVRYGYGLKVGDPVNVRYLPGDPSIIKEERIADAGSFALYGALVMACTAVLIYLIALFRKHPAVPEQNPELAIKE